MITNRKKSQKREKKLAKDISGKSHIMSGGAWFQKGDVSNEHFLVEDKFTEADAYTLSLQTLKKLEKEALQVNKIPIFIFGFTKGLKKDYCIINKKHTIYDCQAEELFITKSIKLNSVRMWKKSPESLILFNLLVDDLSDMYYIVAWDDFLNNIFIFFGAVDEYK